MPRFVILRHEVGDGLDRCDRSHFDWMFETDSVLKTWATEPVTLDASASSVLADALPDHRIAYLDFEGDIGGGRGTVSRAAGGIYELVERSPDRFVAELTWLDGESRTHQRKLRIELACDAESDRSWRLRLSG